jgi:hypothetical protein
MFAYHLISVGTVAYSFFVERVNSSPNGVLFVLGSLLFVVGSVLRRRLPSLEEKPVSSSLALQADKLPSQTYIGTVAEAVSGARAQRHASAV